MPDASPTRPRLGRRIGDLERQTCADELADAFMTGRLGREELETRLDQSLLATTDVDLALLTHDLRPPQAALAARPPARPAVVALTPVGVARVAGFEVVLAALSFVAASLYGTGDWPLIAIFLWASGSVAGAVGAALARPKEPPARAQ